MSILQQLLNVGLVDIGADDSRFEKMKAASESVSACLAKDPALLIAATLVAIDHDVDEADPMFGLVEELVLLQWKTMRNTHTNRPRELLRSVLLDAVVRLTQGNPEAAGVVWCTAAGLVRHGQTRLGKEAAVVERFLHEAWKTAETAAVERAGLAPPVKRTRRKKLPAKLSRVSVVAEVSDSELVEDVARAVGPQYPHGTALPDPNPHWTNSNQNWSYQFAPRMASVLARAVNLGVDRLTASLDSTLSVYLGEFEKRMADQVAQATSVSDATATSAAASRLRLDVLWWSEALYSPSLGAGYREVPLNVAATAAALDLASIVPPLAPTSVVYVLGEALHRIAGETGGGVGCLSDHLDGLGEFGSLGTALSSSNETGRRPLLDLVSAAVAGDALAQDTIVGRSGLDPNLRLSAADFAMWVFHDLQARRLVEVL